jgi:predicted nucleic acid-binding protein
VTVTLDLNVLLDVFQKREPHYAASAQVVARVTTKKITGIFPAHGLTTLYYLARRHASKPEAEKAIDRVLQSFRLGNLDPADWEKARRLPIEDFEDAAVAMVAQTTASEFIVTRNVEDFEGSPVLAVSPDDLMSRFLI